MWAPWMAFTPAGLMPWDMHRFTIEQFNEFVSEEKRRRTASNARGGGG